MRRLLALVFVVGITTSGCYGERVRQLEEDHAATRRKLDSLLVWVGGKQPPDVDLYDWMDAVHTKLWPASGPTDPVKPSKPPPPF